MDPTANRREISNNFQADFARDPTADGFNEKLLAITDGWGVDVFMVTAPFARAQQQTILAADVGGRINLIAGLADDKSFNDFPANLVHYRGLKVIGTTGRSTTICL